MKANPLSASERNRRHRQKVQLGRPALNTLSHTERDLLLPQLWTAPATPLVKYLRSSAVYSRIGNKLHSTDTATTTSFTPDSNSHAACLVYGRSSPLLIGQQIQTRKLLTVELCAAIGLPPGTSLQFGDNDEKNTQALFTEYDTQHMTGAPQLHVDTYDPLRRWLAYTVSIYSVKSALQVTECTAMTTRCGRRYIQTTAAMAVFFCNNLHGGMVEPGGRRLIMSGQFRPTDTKLHPDPRLCIHSSTRGHVIGTHPAREAEL